MTRKAIAIICVLLALLMGSCSPTPAQLDESTVPRPTATSQRTVQARSTVTRTLAPTRTSTPTIGTVAQQPTSAPTDATPALALAYVADVTIADGMVLAAGAAFVKTWRVRNPGPGAWSEDAMLCYVGGQNLGTRSSVELPTVGADEECEVSVEMIAPNTPGEYATYWQLCKDGEFYGPRLYASIVVPTVVPVVAPTIAQRAAPVAPVVPVAPAAPVAPVQPRACCKYCTNSKACGDSCISANKTCHKPPGCACDR